MRRCNPFEIIVLSIWCIVLLRGQNVVHANSGSRPPLADQFPELTETITMAKLSKLVYQFRYSDPDTKSHCDQFNEENRSDLSCHWYLHDSDLGTQVLLVSSQEGQFITIIFAGTDDVRTSLEDADIFTKPFGNNSTIRFPDRPDVRVHAGFDNAVFMDNVWEQVYAHTSALLHDHPTYSLWTTGHSLGAANAILTATALATLGHTVRSISFGCPQTGNIEWRNYFNGTSPLRETLGIWRVVLSWDLVPRLPELFYHVGHTIQMDGKTENEVIAYYEHYGNPALGYAGAPTGWYSLSYAWLPFALNYHHMGKYLDHLLRLDSSYWVKDFFPTSAIAHDDDIYDSPPDDWYMTEGNLDDDSSEVNDDGTVNVGVIQ